MSDGFTRFANARWAEEREQRMERLARQDRRSVYEYAMRRSDSIKRGESSEEFDRKERLRFVQETAAEVRSWPPEKRYMAFAQPDSEGAMPVGDPPNWWPPYEGTRWREALERNEFMKSEVEPNQRVPLSLAEAQDGVALCNTAAHRDFVLGPDGVELLYRYARRALCEVIEAREGRAGMASRDLHTAPITPDEVPALQKAVFPPEVFAAFNELIAESWKNGSASFTVRQAMGRIALKMGKSHQEVAGVWLNVEDIYRAAGWKVTLTTPDSTENFPSSYTFSRTSR